MKNSAADILRRHVSVLSLTDPQIKRLEEELEFEKLKDAKAVHASHQQIPTFYKKASNNIASIVHNEAKQRYLNEKKKTLLDEEALSKLEEFLNKLSKNGFVSFEDLNKNHLSLPPEAGGDVPLTKIFPPSVFCKFKKDPAGAISTQAAFKYAVKQADFHRNRLLLSQYDTIGKGYMQEKDVENFILDLIPQLKQLSFSQEFYPFYVFTAVRKFFFFLDTKRTGL
eukprot:Platyproteum_vivax@DN7099_c0_g1_i2.p1